MIHTQFGDEVELIGYDPSKQMVDVKHKDGSVEQVRVFSLKADEGIAEIMKTAGSLRR